MNLFGLNLVEEYQFTNRSNYEVIKEVSRHIRAIEPADGPDQDSIAGLLADPYKGSSLGVVGYAAAMQALQPALANVYDGDNIYFQAFRPDGHLDPSKKAWIKYEEDREQYVTPTETDDDKFEAHVEGKLGSFNITIPVQAMEKLRSNSPTFLKHEPQICCHHFTP